MLFSFLLVTLVALTLTVSQDVTVSNSKPNTDSNSNSNTNSITKSISNSNSNYNTNTNSNINSNSNSDYTLNSNWVSGRTASQSHLDPAGADKSGTVYVARAQIDGQWIPGRGYYRSRTFYASVIYNGRETETADCQVLTHGGTKWISQQQPRQIPNNAVLAGYDPKSHERTYICRGYINDGGHRYLTVGKVLANSVVCRLPYTGETRANNYDILVESHC